MNLYSNFSGGYLLWTSAICAFARGDKRFSIRLSISATKDLNFHASQHQILSLAGLPIPPVAVIELPGFEPRIPESKSDVLPLHHSSGLNVTSVSFKFNSRPAGSRTQKTLVLNQVRMPVPSPGGSPPRRNRTFRKYMSLSHAPMPVRVPVGSSANIRQRSGNHSLEGCYVANYTIFAL